MKKTLALLLCLVLVAALLPSAVTAFSNNNFWLRWDGDSSYVYTYPGGTATLKVVAYGDDLEGVTYQWYSGTYDSDLGDYPPIEGATSDTYVVENATEDQSFRCKAWDNYGNEDYVWLYVRPNNSFSLSLPDDVTSNVNVAPGSSAELRAIASGIDLEGVTYQWYSGTYDYDLDDYPPIEDATTDTLVLENVLSRSSVFCKAEDKYGHSCELWYYLNVNHFSYEPNCDRGNCYVGPGEDAVLKVIVSGDDLEGVTYTWYDKNTNIIEGATGDTFVISNVTERLNGYNGYVSCHVMDAYGNGGNTSFNIYIENRLTVTPTGAEEGSNSLSLRVDPNATPTLSAAVSAVNMEGITYQWYEGYNEIDGATEASYTVPPVTGYKSYRLRVTDLYGYKDAYFSIDVDNELKAYPEGNGPDDGSSRTYYVEPNAAPTLKAIVSAKDMDNLTYTWYEGSRNSSNIIEGANTASYTVPAVTSIKTYYLTVSDSYGSSVYLSFYLRVDNELEVKRVGQTDSEYSVAPGGSAELAVSVSAKDEDGLSIVWSIYDEDDYEYVTLDRGREVITVTNVTGRAEYRCTVSDKYENSTSIYFYIYVDNRFSASQEGAQSVYVLPGGSATLKVRASATDMDGITYRWNDDDNTSADTLTVSNVTNYRYYYCTVRDKYGNSTTVYFSVYVDNGFSVRPKGASGNSSSVTITVPEGASADLEALITADDTEGMRITWRDDNGSTIPDATGAGYTVPSVTRRANYRCSVSDKYGNNRTVYFNLRVDNDFSAVPEGASGNSSSGTVLVPAGEDATLKANVTARDREGLSIVWSYYDQSNYSYVEVARDTDAYTVENVTGRSEYRCVVTDRFDNSQTLWFYTGVDNDFAARAQQEDFAVPLGGSATLTVNASARDTEGMTFHWHDNSSSGSDDFLGTNTLTVENVSYYTSYYCEVEDKYGNNTTVWFYVSVDNAFSAGAQQQNVAVPQGESATLKVVANARDTEGMSYVWRDDNYNTLSERTDTLTVSNVQYYGSYRCTVTDKYGNSRTAWFYVSVENGFSARPEGAANNSRTIYVPLNGSAELKVNVTATDAEGMSYVWTEQVRDSEGYYDSYELPGVTGGVYTVADVTEYRSYYCRVTDKFGNTATAYFYVGVDNGFTLTAASPEVQSVEKGSDVTLTVSAAATDPEGITYRWRESVKTSDGYYTSAKGEVAGGSSYTVTDIQESRQIFCTAFDKYGNELNQSFTVNIENGFSVARVGDSTQYAAMGSPLTLSVQATATETDGMTYSWRKYTTRNENGGWINSVTLPCTEAAYTVAAVTGAEMYRCTVTDKYGSSQSVSYTVGVENGLRVSYAQGIKNKNYVPYGSTATLGVAASATDAEGLSYRWSEYKLNGEYRDTVAIPGATTATLTVENVTESREFVCYVTDKYGNQVSQWMYTGPENGLSIRSADGQKEYAFTGEPVTLTVIGTATDAEGLSYRWQEMIPTGGNGYSSRNLNVTAASMVVEREGEYRVYVTDKFGNEESIWFKVKAVQGKTGLTQDEDGIWRYYKNGVFQSGVSGLMQNEYGWWYVKNGVLDQTYTGLVTNESGTFYIYNGQLANWVTGYEWVNGEYCEFYEGQLATWKADATVVNPSNDGATWVAMRCGKVDPSYTGMAYNENGTWYLKDGVLDLTYTGLVTNDYGTFYVYQGQFANWRTGYEWVNGEYCEFYEGQLTTWKAEPTLVEPIGDGATWYAMRYGKIDPTYTGLVTNEYGTFYIYQGQMAKWRTGLEVVNGELCEFYNGQLTTWKGSELEQYGSDWYYMTAGKVDKAFTGLAQNEYGWWYVFDGKLDLTYVGLATNEYGTFYVYNGQFANWRTGYEWVNGEFCEFYEGQLTTWKTYATVVNPSGDTVTWTAIRCGKVDPSYTGLAQNEYGWWYISNGALDLSFVGLVTNADGTWFIYNGQLADWITEPRIEAINDGMYYVYRGQVGTWYTGDLAQDDVTYHVSAGVVTGWN